MTDVKIRLPDFLIAELYKGSLVDLDTFNLKEALPDTKEQPAPIDSAIEFAEKIRFLGENEKRVAIIVNEPEAAFLMEDDLTFLTNILKACQLNLADIAIINTATRQVSYEAIKQELQAKNILLFDVEPSAIKLPFLIPAFQLQKFDGCTIMVAPPLPYLNKPSQEGKLLKTKLWLSLKQVFNIA
jgi:hypothetical protein